MKGAVKLTCPELKPPCGGMVGYPAAPWRESGIAHPTHPAELSFFAIRYLALAILRRH